MVGAPETSPPQATDVGAPVEAIPGADAAEKKAEAPPKELTPEEVKTLEAERTIARMLVRVWRRATDPCGSCGRSSTPAISAGGSR